MKTTQRLSDKAYELLLEFEVGGGRNYYETHLKRPTWPGGESGVTIGIGYDCGYNDHATITGDWGEAGIDEHDRARLAAVAGITGQAAKRACKNELYDIVISWDAAWYVFNERTLPKFIRQTLRAFPSAAEKLPADAFGALVSLVFNRGTAMDGSRRTQMRTIRDLIHQMAPGPALQRRVATEIRSMIPIWRGSDIYEGMKRRRNAEADLIEFAA